MEDKHVTAHITHEDGYCSLICQVIWQPTLSDEGLADFLASLRTELERIMKGKK